MGPARAAPHSMGALDGAKRVSALAASSSSHPIRAHVLGGSDFSTGSGEQQRVVDGVGGSEGEAGERRPSYSEAWRSASADAAALRSVEDFDLVFTSGGVGNGGDAALSRIFLWSSAPLSLERTSHAYRFWMPASRPALCRC